MLDLPPLLINAYCIVGTQVKKKELAIVNLCNFQCVSPCVNHIDISDNIQKLQIFIEKFILPKRKKTQLFPISKTDPYAYDLLLWKLLRYIQQKIIMNLFSSTACLVMCHVSGLTMSDLSFNKNNCKF